MRLCSGFISRFGKSKRMILAIVVLGVVEFGWRPRLDKTSEGEWLLWYGNKKRKYYKI